MGTPEKTAHSQAIRKPGRLVNLRCIAHFGFEPVYWLTTFAESILMLLLGTVQDSRFGEYNSIYLNDALYDEIRNIRSKCDLPEPQYKGLNRTWPLLQGWKDFGIKSGAECVNCGRVVPPLSDPAFKRYHWLYADSARPKSSQVICERCGMYEKKHSQPRPAEMEERWMRMSLPTRPRPQKCEYDGCPRTVHIAWVGAAGKFYCETHASRVRGGRAMDSEVSATPRKVVRASGTNPGLCQIGGCKTTHNILWCGKDGYKTYMCPRHIRLAYNGADMTTPISRSTAPSTLGTEERPTKRQYSGCDNGVDIKWCGLEGHKKYYCQAHYRRANLGNNMADPIKTRSAPKPAHSGPHATGHTRCSATTGLGIVLPTISGLGGY